jgi:serine/threonine protein kinase
MKGRTPRLADRYRLDEEIGHGGMATVWRARDLHRDRDVAVKILDRPMTNDPTTVERFRREAQTMTELDHPNVVHVFDYGTDGSGKPFLVMELVNGRSVRAVIADGPLPVRQVVAIGEQVCAALGAVHAAGVVHRDIKPDNIMVTPMGIVKIMDFGIARLPDATQAQLTAASDVIGSSLYIAPEQTQGGRVDARADLYELGAVLYEMLTGSPPFSGKSALMLIHQHRYEKPRPPRKLRRDIPRGLNRLVLDLLAKDPADRPADAETVRARLGAVTQQMKRRQTMVSRIARPVGQE